MKRRIVGGQCQDGKHGKTRHEAAGEESAPTLPAPVQDHLGEQLRILYAATLADALPASLLDLLGQFRAAASEREKASLEAFSAEVLAALPKLRGFALSLAGASHADDLVQETLLKAWKNQDRFEPGTNLLGWLITILRNLFYSQVRKRKREVEDVDGERAAQLIELPQQEPTVMLGEVARHLGRLPPRQRESLILVGAHGMTYEAAADLLGCQVGTVKSRVSRARAFLVDTLRLEPNSTT